MLLTTLLEMRRRKAASSRSGSLFDAAAAREASERVERYRNTVPHCDQRILHAPGQCEYCDAHPEWQQYREIAGIAFSGTPEENGTDYLTPCPSTYLRSPEVRDRWHGNRKA